MKKLMLDSGIALIAKLLHLSPDCRWPKKVVFDRLRNASSYQIQVHISRTSQSRFLIDKPHGVVAILPRSCHFMAGNNWITNSW